MPPLGGQPGVVEVEPANHGADVEGGLHGIELDSWCRERARRWEPRFPARWAQQLGAGRILERFEAAAERVDEAMLRGGVGEIAVDLVIQRVVGDVGEDFVRRGAFIAGCDDTLTPSCSFRNDGAPGPDSGTWNSSPNSLRDRDEFQILRAGVDGGGANDLAVLALLDDVRGTIRRCGP